jgi:hypothetical protein
VTLQTSNIALFAKPDDQAQYANTSRTSPLADIADQYGWQIISGLSR